jgi:hypothetical protein
MNIRLKIAICIIIYNLLGTFVICNVYPADPFYGSWVVYGYFFTLPISIISYGYRYVASEPLYPVFIIQSVVLIVSLFVVDTIVKYYLKRKNK